MVHQRLGQINYFEMFLDRLTIWYNESDTEQECRYAAFL